MILWLLILCLISLASLCLSIDCKFIHKLNLWHKKPQFQNQTACFFVLAGYHWKNGGAWKTRVKNGLEMMMMMMMYLGIWSDSCILIVMCVIQNFDIFPLEPCYYVHYQGFFWLVLIYCRHSWSQFLVTFFHCVYFFCNTPKIYNWVMVIYK